ncbi:Alpha beta hydrolase fold protein [Neofusicoccum parvum]|nr:Alpha beta hydrolase fold protein [Neofusicoccum parvum]
MPTLDVPGAVLDYATAGSGPHIVLVPGAPGNQTVFRFLVPHLSRHFTVTTYSRRGFSNSLLRGAQDYSQRLETDADDLAALLKHVTGGTTAGAHIFGTSSGAVVALSFLHRHADVAIGKCVAHEPPSTTVLPPELRAERQAQLGSIYPLYRAKGAPHALELFASVFPDARDREMMPLLMDPAASADTRADVMYWLEREMAYTLAEWDLGVLEGAGERLVLSIGERSEEGMPGEPVLALQKLLGRPKDGLFVVPGAHIGYLTDPEAFAEALSRL